MITAPKINLKTRLRRNRRSDFIRQSLAETHFGIENLVNPLFVCEGQKISTPIQAMPGISRMSTDLVLKEIESCLKLGLNSFALFPVVSENAKNPAASEALNENGLAISSLKKIREEFPEAVLYTDVALDPFSSDGHDGLVRNGEVLNDESVSVLVKMALLQAEAGADYVSPSDMMDGRVGAIRAALDDAGFSQTGIMAYSAKYASSFYGPFREALASAPKFGDKKTYQMDFRNRREALREVNLDIQEGADIVMVKPALAYLDVILSLKQKCDIPLAAYNVSGEYAMIKLAALAGAIDGDKAALECLTAIRRAGADLIFTYFAKEMAVKFSRGEI